MNRFRGIIAYLLCAVMIADLAFMTQGNVAYATTAGALDQARDEYEDTQERIDATTGEIDNLTAEQAQLQESLDALNTKLEAAGDVLERLDAQIETTKKEIDLTWGKIEELSAQADMLQEKAAEQYELVKAQIKYIYECGDTMYLALLRGSGTYSDYLNRNSYMEMFAEYNQTNINNLQETGRALKETQAKYEEELIKLEQEKAELDEYEQAVQKQYEEIRALVEEASDKVDEYKARISNAEARLSEYESQLAAQEENIGNLEAQLDDELQKTVEAANAEWRDIDNVNYDDSDRKLLANLIWCEAGNEEYLGQVAVGAVVMNRVMSSVFPNTIVGVIYQRKQFSPASSGRLALALSRDSATESCYKAADAALNGVNNIGSCLYFRTPTSKVNPKYVIGNHYFY